MRVLDHELQTERALTSGEFEGGALALEIPQLQRIALLGRGEDEPVWVEHAG
jgi:hypothetical protein